ncbi:MAG: hypothetical protein KDC35_20505 [Acidobacteria bacterium]|nr:hypothetical protein [Acidobacteriota bacterium]
MKYSLAVMLTLIARPVFGQFTQLPSGTTENLNGIWMDDDSPFGVIVGNNGTILHWDGVQWNVVASNTMEHLYDVHGLSATDVVASGQNLVLHWDGLAWSQVISIANSPITPVLLTADRIWYGIPDSQFPIIGRCDRMGQGCLGIVSPVGLVLAMQQHASGDVFFMGTSGSVGRHDATLMNFSYVHEQPIGDLQSFTAAWMQLADPMIPKALKRGEDQFVAGDYLFTRRLVSNAWAPACATNFDVLSVFDFFAGGDDGGLGSVILAGCDPFLLPEPVTDAAVTSELFFFFSEEELITTHLNGLISMNRNCRPLWEMFAAQTIVSYVEAINCDGN